MGGVKRGELESHDRASLAEEVTAADENGDSRMVPLSSTDHQPLTCWDVFDLQEEIDKATKGTGVRGYVAVVRNEKDWQTVALILSPRDESVVRGGRSA